MLLTPDFTEVKDAVEPGNYKVRVVGSKLGEWPSKTEGKPATVYVEWTLETFGEAEEKNNGRKIFHKTPMNGPGAFRLQQFYKGVMGEDIGGEFDSEMLHGREAEVTVGFQVDKNKQPTEYTEVKAVKQITAVQ